jgi:hypothetical protein
MELLSVPFTRLFWNDSYDAQITLHGLVRTEEDGLVLEFRRSENSWGRRPTRDDEIRAVTIPWIEVQSLGYRPWWVIWGALVLRTRSLRALEGVPLARGNELTIPVARRNRMAARELAVTVELALADLRLAAVLDAPPTPPALPPG